MRRSVFAATAVVAALGGGGPATAAVSIHPPQVLRVGRFHGIPGQFSSIPAAVKAARPGDWVLVGPGDYKTTSSLAPSGHDNTPAAVLITTPNLRLRGMNRNQVIVDGTKPGTSPCSNAQSAQNFGPTAGSSGPVGLNGIMVWKAPNVSVDNLTTCNFLGGSGDAGNGVWWNGGDGSAQIGGYGFEGSYLSATSTYYQSEANAAQYGIFSSNWSGGTWNQVYASNFNDSGLYIGACQQVCNQVVNHAWSQYSALGYSGSNSGGSLVIKNSEFDHNEDGFDTNSQNGDDPAPQNGACPGNGISPITHTHSCWVFINNFVHDNNNPDVPAAGLAASGPVGTGMSVSGGRNDTIIGNRFENNNAWGIIFVPFLDNGPPCSGGTPNFPTPGSCLFEGWGNALLNNTFSHNGSYGHPSNGDFAQLNFESGHPTDCASGNTDTAGTFTSSPAGFQTSSPSCTGAGANSNLNLPFLTEVLCDSQVKLTDLIPTACPTGPYPRRTKAIMHPLPSNLATMAKPCAGVPSDPWCSGQTVKVTGCAARAESLVLSLPVGERFRSVSVTIAGKTTRYSASGSSRSLRLALGAARHRTVRVAIVQRIRVGHHDEQISFTRVYHRC
jgi:hypothetical protein